MTTTPQRYPNGPRRFAEIPPAEQAEISHELIVDPGTQFLPLPARRAAYVVALLLVAAAPIIAVSAPDYAAAILAAAAPLEAAALGVALANPTR